MVPGPDPVATLLSRYEEVEFGDRDLATGRGLSGWQCVNPFAALLLDTVASDKADSDRVAYAYLENDEQTKLAIRDFHLVVDGTQPGTIFPGAGANALLFTYVAYLKSLGVTEVYYLSPLYFSLQFALRLFGINARPVSGRHAFEPRFTLNLPQKKTHLLLTDPLWYAGIAVPHSVIKAVREWQQATGSTVFVDGSFQYMPWDGHVQEVTSLLSPDLTFRVLCPTKSLVVHGYRFAYVLLPDTALRPFSNAYSNIYGSTSVENLVFARHAMAAVGARRLTNSVANLVQSRHRKLRASGAISSSLVPDRGYFVFERVRAPAAIRATLMDGRFFDQRRYRGYARLNLLSPALDVLS